MELFTYLMAKNDHNTSVKKDLFSYLLGKNQSGTYTDYSGTSLSINNTKKAKMKVNLLGNTSQTGTPNPDNPETINVVSGDNDVVVSGKNLWEGESSYTGVQTVAKISQPLSNGTYTASYNQSVDGTVQFNFKKNGTTLFSVTKYSTAGHPTETFNVSTTFDEIWLYLSVNMTVSNIQIEKGSSATTYETPQFAKYPIHLPVENLFDVSNYYSLSSNGINATVNTDTGEITLNDTATATAYIRFDLHSTIPAGTVVSYSANNNSTMAQCYLNLALDGSTKQVVQLNTQNAKNQNITLDTDINRVYIQVNNGITLNNFVIKPQLEKGSKANSFTPYGTTPIELCKIGTYQDKFIRNSGKNKFNKDTAIQQRFVNRTTGQLSVGDANDGASDFIDVYGLEKIILSGNNVSYGNGGAFYNQNEEYISGFTSSDIKSGISVPSNAYYVRFSFIYNEINTTMLNEGSTALPYEPYGNGDWYLEKKIEKVVLNGSEMWGNVSSYGSYYRTNTTRSDIYIPSANSDELFSNYFYGDTNAVTGIDVKLGQFCQYRNSNQIFFVIAETTKENWTTWLSTHNTIVYYVLATPTYTKIEGTLKDELDEVYRANSYKGQTNISQINNDLPFELNVSVKVGS